MKSLLKSYSLFALALMAPEGENFSIVDMEQNLSDVKDLPLIKGRFPAQIDGVEEKTSKEKDGGGGGNQYYNVSVTVPTSAYPLDKADEMADAYPDGLRLFYNLLTVPRQGNRRDAVRMRDWYKKLRLPTDTNQIDPGLWIGRDVMVVIRVSKWNDEDRMEIAAIEAFDQAPAGNGKKSKKG